jgi:glycosyltransferase involved in cell wall biosynthesis
MKVVRKQKPWVILSMLTHNNIMAILAGMLYKINVIACEHNTLSEIIKIKEGRQILLLPVRLLVKTLYRFAYRIVTVSEGIGLDLIEEFNISDKKIKTIYNPVNFERINSIGADPVNHSFFKDNIPIIIAIGRLTQQKGFDVLIKAFSRIVKKVDARLIILGEGSEKGMLERLIDTLGLTEKVSLLGFQKNPYPFLSKAGVFVLSSRYEGLPMVILEAMACGIPVISMDCKSGPREILQDGRCGTLIPVGDEVALSEGILKLLKDGALQEKLSKLGKERAKDFSVDKIIKQYESVIYESIVSQDTHG